MIDPHPLIDAMEQHLVKALPEYIALLGLFMVAVIANMPLPDAIQKLLGDGPTALWAGVWYKWLFDSLQAFMAARRPSAPQPSPGGQSKEKDNEP